MAKDTATKVESSFKANFTDRALLLKSLKKQGFVPWGDEDSFAVMVNKNAIHGEDGGLGLFLTFNSDAGYCEGYNLYEMRRVAHIQVDFVTSEDPLSVPMRKATDSGLPIDRYIDQIFPKNERDLVRQIKKSLRNPNDGKPLPGVPLEDIINSTVNSTGRSRDDVIQTFKKLERGGEILQIRPDRFRLLE